MDQMESGPFLLSANRWENRAGAQQLFAPSSRISDNYRYFLERVERSYRFQWKAPRPLADFAAKSIGLELVDSLIKVTLPSDVWLKGTEIPESAKATAFVIADAFHQDEALDIAISHVTGSGKGLSVEVTDKQGISSKVQTRFGLEYYTKRILYVRRFSGKIPPELVSQQGDRFILDLGKLPIDSKFLSSGVQSQISLYITRSFGKESATRLSEVRYSIP